VSRAPSIALTIAGSDPSGGAGIQADLKTFQQFGVYGEAVLTLLTVQNTRGVSRLELVAPDLVRDQIAALLDDMPPAAIKTGALGSAPAIEAVADALKLVRNVPLVIDPVMLSKNGAKLLDDQGVDALRRHLLPFAYLVTPNLLEAEALTGRKVQTIDQMADAARALADNGVRNLLIKGGHLDGDAVDLLLTNGTVELYPSPRIPTRHTHGTGCVYSAAITAGVADGLALTEAVRRAKRFVSAAIANHPGFGKGSGPLDFWARETT
jgi:hydroxymethylpyrimidine/phosphomethylpyrimidine kinase